MKLIDVVRKLVGPVIPVGETREDDERFENLQAEIELIDRMMSDISDVAGEVNRSEYSRKRAGLAAKKFLKDLFESIKDDLEE